MANTYTPGTVRARAPLRLGLAGGGTDVSPYSDDFGGLVLNATIDKFAYATIMPRDDETIELVAADNSIQWSGASSAKLELVKGLELHVGVYNRIVRDYNDGRPLAVTVTTHSEAPPGSGLGSSSTMVVALVHAFAEYLQIPLGEYDIAHLAYDIERVDLAFAGGKQDQYAAAFGGFHLFEFEEAGVRAIPINIAMTKVEELEGLLTLCYTGQARLSSNLHENVWGGFRAGKREVVNSLFTLRGSAYEVKDVLESGNFDTLGPLLDLQHECARDLDPSLTNDLVEGIFDLVRPDIRGGKCCGAGGGGCMLFISESPAKREQVAAKLRANDIRVIDFHFALEGLTVTRRD